MLAMTVNTQIEEESQLTVEHMDCSAPLSGSIRMVDLESLSQSFEDIELFTPPTPDGAMETVGLVSYVVSVRQLILTHSPVPFILRELLQHACSLKLVFLN